MFNVLDGGVSEPVPWSKDALMPDRSVIILVESAMTLYLWHGVQRGLVQRRTALRQAQSLKGHGFTVGKSIIGRDIKEIKEIDARKVGRVPEETKIMEELDQILEQQFRVVEGDMVTFNVSEAHNVGTSKAKPAAKPQAKPEPKPAVKLAPTPQAKPAPKPAAKPAPTPQAKPAEKKATFASEYEEKEKPKPSGSQSNLADARIGFVLKAVLDHYDDIWVSKKSDGSYAVEMMDGPICSFLIKDENVSFSTNSFTGINPNIKTEIKKKYAELAKLL